MLPVELELFPKNCLFFFLSLIMCLEFVFGLFIVFFQLGDHFDEFHRQDVHIFAFYVLLLKFLALVEWFMVLA